MSFTQSGNYSIRKNSIIFTEEHSTQSVILLLQGKLDVYISPFEEQQGITEEELLKKSFKIFTLDSNSFIGVNDLFSDKKYSYSYCASEDSSIYAFSVSSPEQLYNIFSQQKDYASYAVASITSLINHSCVALSKLERMIKMLNVLNDNLVMYFWALREKYGFTYTPSGKYFREGLDNLNKMKEKNQGVPVDILNSSFFEKDFSGITENDYTTSYEINTYKLDYYKHLSSLPADLKKSFFGSDTYIAGYHCRDTANLLNDIQSELRDAFKRADYCFRRLYSDNSNCIFSEYLKAASELSNSICDTTVIFQVLEYISKRIKETALLFNNIYGYSYEINNADLDNSINSIKSCPLQTNSLKTSSDAKTCSIPEELTGSALKILEYSNIPKDRCDLFLSSLASFRSLKDKLSTDAEAKNIRSSLTSVFFEIYQAVFRRTFLEKNESRLFKMFLNFGYMDETLLSIDNVNTLYKLAEDSPFNGACNVYTTKDWLGKIYTMEKDPSINEFGQDYFDIFRDKKRRGELTEKDKPQYDNDTEARLSFEINNMLKINQRLCHGQISVYVPILHEEMITRDLSKAIITPGRIAEVVNKILEVDFSAFHREISYRNPQKGIEKELISKQVLPDFILLPIFGSRAFMWQELAGRIRSNPGRFIFPAFTGEDLDDLILKVVGNFRWELCRTMMGVSWNDIRDKSLTSEYSDYIQFFKKNSDLTDEAKEKIKAQIQKYRNMLRDIFTADYETWINYESKGAVRLNKVVRGILYRNCPFSKQIRENLERQPMYTDIAQQFKNVRAKQARDLESRYNKMIKSGITLDPELEENLRFYKEL